MKSNELFRASGIMALGTILSRITGFIRGILIVAVLGTALLADTYNVANTMPNILYNLLVGGALTAINTQLIDHRIYSLSCTIRKVVSRIFIQTPSDNLKCRLMSSPLVKQVSLFSSQALRMTPK